VREEGNRAPDDDPTAPAKFVSAGIAGIGVLAASGSDREELRRVATVAVKAFDKKPRISSAPQQTGRSPRSYRPCPQRDGRENPGACAVHFSVRARITRGGE
jgi:hypothetical protein